MLHVDQSGVAALGVAGTMHACPVDFRPAQGLTACPHEVDITPTHLLSVLCCATHFAGDGSISEAQCLIESSE